MLFRFRLWLIRLLIGNLSVIANATVSMAWVASGYVFKTRFLDDEPAWASASHVVHGCRLSIAPNCYCKVKDNNFKPSRGEHCAAFKIT